MLYYIEILLFLSAIPTSLCFLSGVNKPLRQSFYKSDPECQEVKCPPVTDPICVRLTYVTPTLKPKAVYVVMLNKCELKYVKCHQGVQAFEKPMEYCDHGITNNKTEIKKRIKRSVVEPRVNGSTAAQVVSTAKNNPATSKAQGASESSSKGAKKVNASKLPRRQPKKKSEYKSKTSKIAKKTVPKKKRKLQTKKKLNASIKPPKFRAVKPIKKRAEGSDLDTDGQKNESGKKLKANEKAPHSDLDEAGQSFIPSKVTAESGQDVVPSKVTAESGQDVVPSKVTAESGQDGDDPESDLDDGGQYYNPGEGGKTPDGDSDGNGGGGNGPAADSDLDGGGQYYEPPDDGHDDGPHDDPSGDNNGGGVMTKDGVNMPEYNAACPSVCPARTMMLCAMCKDGIYRTFMSVCHMRQFHCHHPDEKLALVSRKPCVMSAPYVQNGSPQGVLEEFGDQDTVLRWFRCKETNQEKPVYWSKLNCKFD